MIRVVSLAVVILAACGGAAPSPDGGEGADGGNDAGVSGPPWMNDMLAAHNQVRANATPAPSPALAPLTWSTQAAAVAQAWADGCTFAHNAGRGSYGENIFASSAASTAQQVVSSWAAEAPRYDYAQNTCSAVCGHYTQLVWRSTTAVGCGTARCTTNSPLGSGPWTFWVCDYAPPGNVSNQRPY